ncbi:tetratricopeptide repeat protein [Novosphingobium cyanobacteriorum]|uniref:Tetratricopeptide repeat protein n=1 Tax=Novosphingobium cyanobacteriorum TaxID=3024215 RepID=A0ABT6CQA0_9SPHN|nr:tetratricopeptide repeat protein [Novosphingobium cyanobacteriorum]MDF8335433.1 tetratricopeptide repeat protein [Novosphingobium cyanobacteriorum]
MKSLGIASLALAMVLAGCGQDPKASAEAARKHFAVHDFVAAQSDLAVALGAFPDDAGLIELHARNALMLGDGVAAGASLQKLATAKRPKDYALLVAEAALLRGRADDALQHLGADGSARAQRIRGLALLAKNDRAGAKAAFEAGLKAEPADPRLLAAAAKLALMGGDAVAARTMVDKALAADGGALDPMIADGIVSTAEGDLARALASYDKAAKAYPGNLAALTGKVGVLGDLGRIDEMEAALKAMPGNDPDGTVAYLTARAAAERGKWDKVREILQASEDKLTGRDDAVVLYARALIALGQPEQARARLAPLLTRNPDNLLVRREMAKAQIAGHDPAGAVQTLKVLARSKDAAVDDLRLLASAAKDAGDPDLATYEARARFPSPRALGAALTAGDAAMRAGNWGNAVKAYDQIMAGTDGKNALVLNNLAWAHSQLGNTAKALDYAKRAYAVAPDNPSVMDTYGWLLVQSGGDKAKALSLLRGAAAKAPANRTIRDHLRQAQQG